MVLCKGFGPDQTDFDNSFQYPILPSVVNRPARYYNFWEFLSQYCSLDALGATRLLVAGPCAAYNSISNWHPDKGKVNERIRSTPKNSPFSEPTT